MIRKPTHTLRNELARDIYWLYVIHVLNYLFPLLLIPYLARVLGPAGWGTLAFALSFGYLITWFVEYGFGISAQREAARLCDDDNKLAELLSDVIAAKLILAVLVTGIALPVSKWILLFQQEPRLIQGALFYGITYALNLTWYLRGIRRMRTAAVLEAIAKFFSTVSVVWLVEGPSDSWKYFVGFGVSHLIVLAGAYAIATRDLTPPFPTVAGGIRTLREGSTFFLLHGTGVVFAQGNVVILGLLARPEIVGYYAGAEKIARVFAYMLDPVRNSIFPRVVQTLQVNELEMRGKVNLAVTVTTVASLLLGGVVYISAPALVVLILGNNFSAAVPALKMLSLLPPIIAVSAGLGHLWVIPMRKEPQFTTIMLAGISANATLALLLVPEWQQLGMSMAVVTAELLVALLLWCLYLKDRRYALRNQDSA
jgi:PST family polysaccharide transporter